MEAYQVKPGTIVAHIDGTTGVAVSMPKQGRVSVAWLNGRNDLAGGLAIGDDAPFLVDLRPGELASVRVVPVQVANHEDLQREQVTGRTAVWRTPWNTRKA